MGNGDSGDELPEVSLADGPSKIETVVDGEELADSEAEAVDETLARW